MKPGRIYRNVTVLFADIVGFTQFSNDNGTRKVVEMLSQLFTAFDKECSRLGLYKVYTIGDCYVVMGFLDNDNRKSPEEEANDVTLLAISMIETINRLRAKLNITTLNMRIGIHTVSLVRLTPGRCDRRGDRNRPGPLRYLRRRCSCGQQDGVRGSGGQN